MQHKTNTGGLLLGLVLGLTLFSCRVGRDYRRPELQLPDHYRHAPVTTYGDTAGIAALEWRKFFTDTTLQGLIAKGIRYNYDLQLAVERIAAAEQRLKAARLAGLPQADLQIGAQYNHPSKNSLNGMSAGSVLHSDHLEDYNASAGISWEADIWGKIRRQKEIARTQYLQTHEAKKAVQSRLVSDIARGFYQLLMLDKQLKIARQNLALSDNTLKLTRLLRDAGEATTLSVQQTEAQQKAIAALIPQLEQGIALQENALQLLTGQFPGTVARTVNLSDITIPDFLPAGLPVALVSRRPDVRSAEMDVIVANAAVGIRQAEMYPSLSISAEGGVNALKASSWFTLPGSLFGVVTGGITQPLFDRRRLKTDYAVAKIEREQSVTAFRQTVLQAVTEVSDALIKTDKLRQQEKTAAEQVAILKKAISNAQQLYKNAMANYLEVISAQSSALQAQLDLADIRSRELSAAADLYMALGGGWR
ncbi:efflux transporter outer membrane subunit [Compostibacter hankyongensis]|uniref:Efflux transporter outer membrane subunit n=1 Tax=Compostibacter hankyongensis TaxID=1007089 RepID=A0ABP8FII3_9BACT